MGLAMISKIMKKLCRRGLLLLCIGAFLMTLILRTSHMYTQRSRLDTLVLPVGNVTNISPYRTGTSQTTAMSQNITSTSSTTSSTTKSTASSSPVTSPTLTTTHIMMDNTDGCQNASSYDAIVGVHSAPTNAAQREAYRWYYGDFNKTSPYKLKVFFFIGQVDNLILQYQLTNESQQFGDLVQGSFLDSYRNLTYKAIFTFKWLNDHCQGMRLLLRLDDDVFLGLPHFLHAWDVLVVNKTNSILCDVLSGDIVFRGGKWPVEKSDIAEERYNFNRCLGYFSAIAPDLLPKMVEAAMKTRFFWIDDVFLYGFVAKKVGVAFVNVADKVARWKEKSVEECIRTQRDKCDFVAFLVSVKKFYYLYGLMRTDSSSSSSSLPVTPIGVWATN
ncbi:hypothetical protein Btru_026443 [Bulinus truncatus]|nr:hypothetical protein Btru_026443 [Bulinus truncatus]